MWRSVFGRWISKWRNLWCGFGARRPKKFAPHCLRHSALQFELFESRLALATATPILPGLIGPFTNDWLAVDERAVVDDYADRLLQIIESRSSDGHIVDDGWATYYPAMLAMNLLSGYLVTGNERFRDLAIRQLDYSLTLENRDGVFVSRAHDPANAFIGRDGLARHIMSLYVGYRLTRKIDYLRHAENNASAAITRLPRFRSDATNGAEIFYSQYDPQTYIPWHDHSFLNPNQDSAMALAMLFLYHDPQSVFFHDEVLGSLARGQVEAAMSIQQPSGEIPVSAWPYDPADISSCYDTGYGAYTAWSWSIIQSLEHNQEYAEHIRRAASWLAPYSQPPQPFENVCYDLLDPHPTQNEYSNTLVEIQEYLDRFIVFVESESIPDGYETTYLSLLSAEDILSNNFQPAESPGKIGRQFSLAIPAIIGQRWSDFRLGRDPASERATVVVKSVTSDDGRKFELDSNGWLSVDSERVWEHSRDFELGDDGTLFWLSDSGLLQRRLVGTAWENIDADVTQFALHGDGRVYSLRADGWLSVDGDRVWSDTRDFALVRDGSFYWLGTAGLLQRRQAGGGWEDLASHVVKFSLQEDGTLFHLDANRRLSVDGEVVWANTYDFALQRDGGIYWLSTEGLLQHRAPGGTWKDVDRDVVEFALRKQQIVARTAHGDVTVDGVLAWPGIAAIRLVGVQALEFESFEGELFQVVGPFVLSSQRP